MPSAVELSKNRLIQNEQLIREQNTAAKKAIKKYLHNTNEVQHTPVAFVCECSILDCNEHVSVSIKRYEEIHERQDRFLIFEGHETPALEKLMGREDDSAIVQKMDLPA